MERNRSGGYVGICVCERESEREIKIVTIHGSSSIPLGLLYPELLSDGVLRSFETFHYLSI